MTLVISAGCVQLFCLCSQILLIYTPNCPLQAASGGGRGWVQSGKWERGCKSWERLEGIEGGERKVKRVWGELCWSGWGKKDHLGTQMTLEMVYWPRWAPNLCCIVFLHVRRGKERGHKVKGSKCLKRKAWKGTESYKKYRVGWRWKWGTPIPHTCFSHSSPYTLSPSWALGNAGTTLALPACCTLRTLPVRGFSVRSLDQHQQHWQQQQSNGVSCWQAAIVKNQNNNKKLYT